MQKKYEISGTVVDPEERKGLAGLSVEVWDKDRLHHDFLGRATTEQDGSFSVTFDARFSSEAESDTTANLFFRIFREGQLVLDTLESKVVDIGPGRKSHTIELSMREREYWRQIRIESFIDLLEQEKRILKRIRKIPNGGNLFMIHPLMLFEDIGVDLSGKARKELLKREPTLKGLSRVPYQMLKKSRCPQSVRYHINGLFRKEVS